MLSFSVWKGSEQGGSEAEENNLNGCFRRRGNERSEAIGAGAPGQNPFGRAKKKTIAFAIVFFSYIRLTASDIASQWYSAKAEWYCPSGSFDGEYNITFAKWKYHILR